MRSVFYPSLINGPFGDPALYVRVAHLGEALLFDCGDLQRLTTREMLKIRGVFVSHAHIDHLIGFDQLLRAFLYQDTQLLLCGPPGIAEQIAGRLSGYTWNLVEGYPFSLRVREWGEKLGRQVVFRAGNAFRPEEQEPWAFPQGQLLEHSAYGVRGVALDHGGIISLGFALEEPLHVAIHKDALECRGYLQGPWLTRFKDLVRSGASAETPTRVPLAAGGEISRPLGELVDEVAHTERGMKICYVTDAAPVSENFLKITRLADQSHLLVIEAPFSHEEIDRARQRNHLTARLAGELARRAAVARLQVFHHSPRYQSTPQLLEEEARQAFAGATVAGPG
ncbi:ribonuclease Z [Desulfuromonas versatilis]|uniref:Ribonuclease Z n=1 Tax=Desulfuromonas versatilis TaxID=2802975 RepID=A0ABM8HPE7_9BACT|nr:MBL fold metallo-hydrolase [Desulfuromonas versatilis]BCR03520.1 ribonuclease Z [Desulfuromonas versatilis]